MKTRKTIGIVMSVIMVITSFTIQTFASRSVIIDDPTDNNAFLIVIQDADGKVEFTQLVTRHTYIDGVPYTISAGGTLTTYQYRPSSNFSIGYLVPPYTTANRNLTLSIYNSPSIGGTRYLVKGRTVNTSTTPPDQNGSSVGSVSVYLAPTAVNSSRPYYNGTIINNSSSSATVALLVTMD